MALTEYQRGYCHCRSYYAYHLEVCKALRLVLVTDDTNRKLNLVKQCKQLNKILCLQGKRRLQNKLRLIQHDQYVSNHLAES